MKVDGSSSLIDIATSGLRAQDKRMRVISSNVANAQATDDGSGQAYRRLETLFKADQGELNGVMLDDIVEDMSEMPRILKPGHPHADEQGFVTMPNVNMPIEMMELTMAARGYQANTAVLKRYQRMVDTVLELLR